MMITKKVKVTTDIGTETKELILAFSKLFDIAITPMNDEEFKEVDKEEWFISDNACVFGVSPKSDFGKSILRNFLEEGQKVSKKPKYEIKEIGSSKISLEFIKPILNIFDTYDEVVTISAGKNYLLRIENDDFCFIIAPRVDED